MRLLASALSSLALFGLSTPSAVAEHRAGSSLLSQLKPRSKGHISDLPPGVADELKARLASRVQHVRSNYLRQYGHRPVRRQRRSRRGAGRHAWPWRASLASSGVDVEPQQFAAPEDTKPSSKQPSIDVFAGSNPLIGRALDSMDGQLKLLRGQREATQAEGEQLKDSAQKAFDGLSGGAAIRRKLTGAKAAIHVENQLIEKLEEQEEHVKQEHDYVWSNLHQTMEPRIAVRQTRLETSQARLGKTEKEVRRWGLISEERKASALETIKQRKQATDDLQAAEEAVKQAALAEAKAQKSYKEANREVGQQVQALRLSQTKLKAAQSTEGTEQEQVSQEEIALDRTKGILKAEESRLDKALSSSRVRLDRRIVHAKSVRAKAEHMLEKAKESYAGWKANQQQHSQEVNDEKVAYNDKRRAYEQKREEVLKLASDKAGARATAESDWNNMDWAWSGGGELGDEAAADVPLSAEASD